MSSTVIRAVLVDDEALARLAVRQALASHPDVQIVGECGSAMDARHVVSALEPDLVFLDIGMPGMTGFEYLQELDPLSMPMVIFTTADNRQALQAFDANALDYLLKPLDQARFDHAMRKVRQHRSVGPGAHMMPAPALERISVQMREGFRVIAVPDIDWIRADGNYVRIRANGAEALHRETLSQLAIALDSKQFLRIHRGTLVNIDRIRELHPTFHGGAEVVLQDGTRLPLSRRFSGQARRALGMG